MIEIGGNCDINLFSQGFVLVYFYPKDNTPGCTIESQDFSKLLPEFQKLGIKVYGVSMDDQASHDKFSKECNLSVDLISDVDGKICNAFGVIGEKINFGKKYIGINRSTFFLKDGVILNVWKSVKVQNHAQIVLEKLTNYFNKNK